MEFGPVSGQSRSKLPEVSRLCAEFGEDLLAESAPDEHKAGDPEPFGPALTPRRPATWGAGGSKKCRHPSSVGPVWADIPNDPSPGPDLLHRSQATPDLLPQVTSQIGLISTKTRTISAKFGRLGAERYFHDAYRPR